MRRFLFSLAAFSLTVPVAAQEASVVAPQAYKKQLENDWVKVTRVHYEPHERLGEHDHPARPSIYIYLNDGGPVLFKHEHGDSGEFAATRAATKAGSYRLAWTRKETHIVENRSDLPSDFLQVELKTDIDPKTFTGRRSRDADAAASYTRIEFETPQLRLSRVMCRDAADCSSRTSTTGQALLVDFSERTATWLGPSTAAAPTIGNRKPGEYLMLELTAARPANGR